MPADKAKIIAALNEKFKGRSVSKNYKEALAAKWAAKIESDEAIEDYVSDREDDILEASKEADARATAAANRAKQDAADLLNGKAKTDTPTAEELNTEGMPEWFKAYAKQQQEAQAALAAKVSGFEQANTRQTIEQRFKADERLKGIPAELLHGRYPQSEAEYDAAVEATQQALKPFVERLATVDFGKDTPGAFGGGQPAPAGKVKEASDKELDVLMANIPI